MVDDNPINLIVAKSLLQKWDYDVETAKDGVEALEMFEIGKYAIILMDIHMPKMCGLEASLAIRRVEEKENAPNVPIVAFTADVFLDDQSLIPAKIERKLLKPFQPEELKKIVDHLVSA